MVCFFGHCTEFAWLTASRNFSTCAAVVARFFISEFLRLELDYGLGFEIRVLFSRHSDTHELAGRSLFLRLVSSKMAPLLPTYKRQIGGYRVWHLFYNKTFVHWRTCLAILLNFAAVVTFRWIGIEAEWSEVVRT